MSQEDVDLVRSLIAATAEPGQSGMPEVVFDEEIWERNRQLISLDVEVRFITPAGVGVMQQQEYEGFDGLIAGWREWMQPWEEFRVALVDTIDAGSGQVLLLGRATARMRGTGTEVPQDTAALWRIEHGKIAAVAFYLDQEQARRDAGAG